MRADKRTAVEFLIDELYMLALHCDVMEGDEFMEVRKKIFETAKAMEREALIEFYEDGLYAANYPHALNGPAYYEKEYGNKN